MKRFLAVLVLLVLMLGLGTAVVYATPTPTPPVEGIDLAPLDLNWSGEVNPGDKTTFVLTYANKGTETIPSDTSTKFTLALKTIDDGEEVVSSVSDPFSVAGMVFGETRIVTSTLIVPEEKAYTIEATIESISNEADEENNSLRKTFNVSSALPPEIANLFAGLGMFAAVMAVVAVGTEVVVDSVRVMLGLKRKVTALEALDELKAEMPGQLATLGVSAPKVEEFKGYVDSLKKTVTPAADAAGMATLVRKGELGEILIGWMVDKLTGDFVKQMNVILDGWGSDKAQLANDIRAAVTADSVAAVIKKLLEGDDADFLKLILLDPKFVLAGQSLRVHLELAAEDKLNAFIDSLLTAFKMEAEKKLDEIPAEIVRWLDESTANNKIKLTKGFRDDLKSAVEKILKEHSGKLKNEINTVTAATIFNWLRNIFTELGSTIKTGGPEAAADWLEQNAETLLTRGGQEVVGQFDKELRPFLVSLGLPETVINDTRKELDKGLGYLGDQARASSKLYITSLKELLLTVEERRNDMQSPFRKIWRAMRNSSFSLAASVLALLAAVLVGRCLPLFDTEVLTTLQSVLISIGLLILFFGIAGLGYKFGLLPEADKRLRKKQTELASPEFDQLDEKISSVKSNECHVRMVQAWLKTNSLAEAGKAGGVRYDKAYRWLHHYLSSPVNMVGVIGSKAEKDPKRPDGLLSYWLIGAGDFFFRLETIWNFVIGRPNTQGQVESGITRLIEKLDADFAGTQVAAVLQERADQHRDEEASRLRWLRVVSLLIGVVLAYALNIDAGVLLDAVIPGISTKVNELASLPQLFRLFGAEKELTAGMILTGLAASAGSAFWHDQLDRLQAAKRGAEEAAKLVREIQGSKLGE